MDTEPNRSWLNDPLDELLQEDSAGVQGDFLGDWEYGADLTGYLSDYSPAEAKALEALAELKRCTEEGQKILAEYKLGSTAQLVEDWQNNPLNVSLTDLQAAENGELDAAYGINAWRESPLELEGSDLAAYEQSSALDDSLRMLLEENERQEAALAQKALRVEKAKGKARIYEETAKVSRWQSEGDNLSLAELAELVEEGQPSYHTAALKGTVRNAGRKAGREIGELFETGTKWLAEKYDTGREWLAETCEETTERGRQACETGLEALSDLKYAAEDLLRSAKWKAEDAAYRLYHLGPEIELSLGVRPSVKYASITTLGLLAGGAVLNGSTGSEVEAGKQGKTAQYEALLVTNAYQDNTELLANLRLSPMPDFEDILPEDLDTAKEPEPDIPQTPPIQPSTQYHHQEKTPEAPKPAPDHPVERQPYNPHKKTEGPCVRQGRREMPYDLQIGNETPTVCYGISSKRGLRQLKGEEKPREHNGPDLVGENGKALKLGEPIYFTGFFPEETAMVTEVRHPQGKGDSVIEYASEIGGRTIKRIIRHQDPQVEEGDVLTSGTLIATVATHGNSRGPHIHAEFYISLPGAAERSITLSELERRIIKPGKEEPQPYRAAMDFNTPAEQVSLAMAAP